MRESFKFTSLASNPAVTPLRILCLWIQHPCHSTAREYRLQRRVLNIRSHILHCNLCNSGPQQWASAHSPPCPEQWLLGKQMAQLPVSLTALTTPPGGRATLWIHRVETASWAVTLVHQLLTLLPQRGSRCSSAARRLGSGPGCLWSHWLSSPPSPRSPGKAQSRHWSSRPWLSPGTSGSCWSARRWSRPKGQSTGGRACSRGRRPSTPECTCHSVDPPHPRRRHTGQWTGHTAVSRCPWGRSHRLEGRRQCWLSY